MIRPAGLSIFARTFLMIACALVSAEAVGYVTFTLRGPPAMASRDGIDGARDALRGSANGDGHEASWAMTRMPGDGPVGMAIKHGHVWRVMAIPQPPPPHAIGLRLAWMLVINLLLVLPFAWLFAHALSAPIRHFAEAAHRLGDDTFAPPLQRRGPSEVRRAIDAFNAMQARINRMMQERTHMIAAIAHDLRTPLMRLSFRLDGLPEPTGSRVEADILEMKQMIAAALEFTRDRSRGLHRQPLDFGLLVESVADDLADLGHDVSFWCDDTAIVNGDPVALRRAVVNLVENGLKYGDRVRLRVRHQEGRSVLEVDDDGPGIPEAMQQHVFEPFFRLETSRSRDTGGIGLGLASVRAIVTEHGGEVHVMNRREGGLRAVITLTAWLHA